ALGGPDTPGKATHFGPPGPPEEALRREQESIASEYTTWKQTLVRRALLLPISPWPLDIFAARTLLQFLESEERSGIEGLLHAPDAAPFGVRRSRHTAGGLCVESAEEAATWMGWLLVRLRSAVFFIENAPREGARAWTAREIRQSLNTLDALER